MKQRLAAALDSLNLANEVHQPLEQGQRDLSRENLRMAQGISKQMVLLNVSHEAASSIMTGSSFVVNREGRVKNINDEHGQHLFSPRLRDGGMSLANAGAQAILEHRSEPIPVGLPRTEWWGHVGKGPAVVVVDSDAEPFVRKGRNVFHGFVMACDPWLAPGEPCLITNQSGQLLGHGVAQCTSTEMGAMTKGIAIKTRGGVGE
jgi:archaeosine-15-forming tRNA-guanine transglycosylase